MSPSQRQIGLAVAIVAGVLLTVAAYSLRGSVVEHYWVWKLSSDLAEERDAAMYKLEGTRSRQTIRSIIRRFQAEPGTPGELSASGQCLVRIGWPVVEELIPEIIDPQTAP